MVDQLSGTLRAIDGPRHDLLELVATEFEHLIQTVDPRDVLVLKRHPEGLHALEAALATGGHVTPQVRSLPEHASRVIEEHDPSLDRLGYEERIELISLVIEGTTGELTSYLERASMQEPFVRDVGQLLLEATRQRVTESDHDELAACYRIMDRYHEVLTARGYVERPAIVPKAVALLEANADGLCDRVTDAFDAIFAVEFEEFRALDRRYLAALAGDDPLVCVGERNASTHRTAVEPGPLEAIADGLTVEDVGPASDDEPPHAAVTSYLATGEAVTGDGTVRHLAAGTMRQQDAAVAAEIDALVTHTPDLAYDAVAVVCPRVERIPDARRRLREAGVPTDALGTDTLVADPVVNELYAVVTRCASADRDPTSPDEATIAMERLEARVDDAAAHLEAIAGRPVRPALEAWVQRTDLKDRIASEEEWVDAREQFASVRRILEIAAFVTETDLVAADWAGMRRMLRRTIEYDAPHVHAVETSPPAGGVTVCALPDVRFDHREVVFLLDLVDRSYPGEPHLTQLFPPDWLRQMDGFPAVTDPDRETVERTFGPAAREGLPTEDGFAAYHAQRSRRALAVGCRAARRHLYWCTYEREASGLRRSHAPSRFLPMAVAAGASTVPATATPGRRGRRAGIEAVLSQPWAELERLLGEATVGGEADLRETEAVLEEIAVLCAEADVDPGLVDAIHTQFELAAGEVLRDD